jgi:DNA-binding FadR family transcriptional regulator
VGSRAEEAADQIAAEAQRAGPGVRLGSRADLRARCEVSVGTLHEALRILQSRGEIAVRSGPGGGVFAAEPSALNALLQRVRTRALVEPDFVQAARVLDALAPLAIEDAIGSLDDAGEARLRQALEAVVAARDEPLDAFVRASLEVFATLVQLPGRNVLSVVAGSVLQIQAAALPGITGPIDAYWRPLVEAHTDAVSQLVAAVCDRDPDAALAACRNAGFMGIFLALASRGHG